MMLRTSLQPVPDYGDEVYGAFSVDESAVSPATAQPSVDVPTMQPIGIVPVAVVSRPVDASGAIVDDTPSSTAAAPVSSNSPLIAPVVSTTQGISFATQATTTGTTAAIGSTGPTSHIGLILAALVALWLFTR